MNLQYIKNLNPYVFNSRVGLNPLVGVQSAVFAN